MTNIGWYHPRLWGWIASVVSVAPPWSRRDGSDPLAEGYSMERLQDIPSCKALPLEVEDRELLCEYGVAIWRNPRIFVYYFLSICAFFVLLP